MITKMFYKQKDRELCYIYTQYKRLEHGMSMRNEEMLYEIYY